MFVKCSRLSVQDAAQRRQLLKILLGSSITAQLTELEFLTVFQSQVD